MASDYDYETGLTFRKTEKFWNELNKQMEIKDRDTLNRGSLYHLVLFSNIPSNFNNCIDERGCLLTQGMPASMERITEGYTDVPFHLGVEWLDDGENGFNLFLDELQDNSQAMSDENKGVDVNIPIDDEEILYIKGVALCKITGESSNKADYVVAYAHLSTRIKCENYISLMYGSSFVGHESCQVA